MMNAEILLIAGPEDSDAQLLAAVAAHRPQRVTVLLEASDPNWGWSSARTARTRRDRLAALLTAVEQTTGASVVGLVGDPAELQLDGFDAVVGGRQLRSVA